MLGWLRKYQSVVRAIPDRILLGRIKRGDRDAYGKLYMKYIDQIYRYVYYRINQNTQEAEDITEVVFFKAYKTIKNFHPNGTTLQSWFYQIARNAVIDFYRTSGRRAPLDEHLIDMAPSHEERLEKSLEIESLKKALLQLSEIEREVVTLKYIEDLPYAHIASVLDKSEEAVRAISSRALKELRKELHA